MFYRALQGPPLPLHQEPGGSPISPGRSDLEHGPICSPHAQRMGSDCETHCCGPSQAVGVAENRLGMCQTSPLCSSFVQKEDGATPTNQARNQARGRGSPASAPPPSAQPPSPPLRPGARRASTLPWSASETGSRLLFDLVDPPWGEVCGWVGGMALGAWVRI